MGAIIESPLASMPRRVDRATLLPEVRTLVRKHLVGQVNAIDADGAYPEACMRELGRAGAYAAHLTPYRDKGPTPDLGTTIEAMSVVGEVCLSTAFCFWCQSALGWYVSSTDNTDARAELLASIANGTLLGGTGLSNPMKSFFGIEKLALRAVRVDGGWQVSGRLPWVSNLGEHHAFGIVFEDANTPGQHLMAIVDCDSEGLGMVANDNFLSMGGTRTYGLGFKSVFVPDGRVIADSMREFLPRIRAGFILLQSGMAFGMIRSCVEQIRRLEKPLGHVNQYLVEQADGIEAQLNVLEATVADLVKTPYDAGRDYFVSVLQARLAAGEASVHAAHALMLHAGARGFVTGAVAQRRLREAYFVAIVTPATKQLRKMLADMGAEPQNNSLGMLN